MNANTYLTKHTRRNDWRKGIVATVECTHRLLLPLAKNFRIKFLELLWNCLQDFFAFKVLLGWAKTKLGYIYMHANHFSMGKHKNDFTPAENIFALTKNAKMLGVGFIDAKNLFEKKTTNLKWKGQLVLIVVCMCD